MVTALGSLSPHAVAFALLGITAPLVPLQRLLSVAQLDVLVAHQASKANLAAALAPVAIFVAKARLKRRLRLSFAKQDVSVVRVKLQVVVLLIVPQVTTALLVHLAPLKTLVGVTVFTARQEALAQPTSGQGITQRGQEIPTMPLLPASVKPSVLWVHIARLVLSLCALVVSLEPTPV
jgi:hypothetical protein